jgi:hypothetical protein
MRFSGKMFRSLMLAAGMAAMVASAPALLTLDAKILIDRALNSPALTVRYTGANATLVELRINGESVGTRTVISSRQAGETNFTIDLESLKDGDNEVVVRLFDRTGKLVGEEKTNISIERGAQGPVVLTAPKAGATLMGPVELKIELLRQIPGAYVSFFVNEQFKSMTNVPPFVFLWDTSREPNGWHEIEAWVVDGSGATLKTRKTRVFVNNPGGRTNRRGVSDPTTSVQVSTNPVRTSVEGTPKGVRGAAPARATAAGSAGVRTPAVPAATATNAIRPTEVGKPSGLKSVPTASGSSTGARTMTPTGSRNVPSAQPAANSVKASVEAKARPAKEGGEISITASATKAPPVKVAQAVAPARAAATAARATTAASGLVPITRGTRLPNLATFAVTLNSEFVNFDVNPRVDEGVPMAPFRHLIEQSGGTVKWASESKEVRADSGDRRIFIRVGDKIAVVNEAEIRLELAPYIDRGRTIVPLSFLSEALNVTVEFDKATGHVLITSKK